jgi:hypothetical protein
MRFRNRVTARTYLLLIVAPVVWAIVSAPVLAQEDGSKQFRGTVGPYEINIVEIPSNLSLGRVQVDVTVLNVATGQRVPDARVVVRTKVEISSPLGKVSVEAPPVVVPSGRNSSAGSFVFVGISLVLVLGVLYVWWTIRREQQRRSRALTNGE